MLSTILITHNFDQATLQQVGQPGRDVRLRQNTAGQWQFTPAHLAKHRISAVGNGSEQWVTKNPYSAQPFRARLEALYSVAPYDGARATVLADFADLDLPDNRRNAAGVIAQVELEATDVKAGGRSLRFRAANASDSPRGAWAQIGSKYKHPYFSMLPGDALGLWVKGDGSGALLNIQIRSPREYHDCISDHYIDLDFTGWRYVEILLRERDSERLTDYVWPYGGGGSHAIYRNAVDRAHISEVNLLLNEIPAKGKVDILVSPIVSLTARRAELANPSLELGGSKVLFPVTLQSGQYIELEGIDDCVLYDERGELISRFRPQVEKLPLLAEGANAIRFGCTPPQGQSARAEITVVSLGQPFGGRRPDAEIDWKWLDREHDIPRIVTRLDGADNVWNIVRRSNAPGGQEKPPVLEIELAVPQLAKPEKQAVGKDREAFLAEPVLAIGEQSVRFPVRLRESQQLVCRDQATWRVFGAEVAAGQVAGTFPTLLPGANRVTLASQAQPAADFRVVVKTVKVYR